MGIKRSGALSSVPPRRFAAPAEQRKSRAKAAQLRPEPRSSSYSLSQIFSLWFWDFFFFSGRFSFPRCHHAAFGFRALRVGAGRWDRGAFSPFPSDYFLLPKSPQPRTPPPSPSFLPPFAPSESAFISFICIYFSIYRFETFFFFFFNHKFRPFPRRSRFLSLSLFAGNRRYLSSFSR